MLNHLLTEKELALVVELLQNESEKLMRETRHTDVRAAREELRERLRMVDRLVERFNEIKAGLLKP